MLREHTKSNILVISSHKKSGLDKLKLAFQEILNEKNTTN